MGTGTTQRVVYLYPCYHYILTWALGVTIVGGLCIAFSCSYFHVLE
jgi:hypothetical protein